MALRSTGRSEWRGGCSGVMQLQVLLVSPFLPYPPSSGARIRIYHLLRGLAQRHDVTLLAGINDERERDHVESLRAYCREIVAVMISGTPRSPGVHVRNLLSATPYYRLAMCSTPFRAQFAALMQRRRFDVIQVELLHAANIAASARGASRILDMHNVESVYFRRLVRNMRPSLRQMLLLTDALKLPAYERRMISAFDHCLAVSEKDAALLQRLVPRARIRVIPNGVDPTEFSPRDSGPRPNSLVFTASFAYPPNVDAMLFFCREVFPCIRNQVPAVHLRIVGQQPPPTIEALGGLPGIEVTGKVPDVRPHLAGAAVVIVPLRIGSGTRLKILEAMAMGKPVVSTSVGAEGLCVSPGRDLEIADSATAFANATVALLRDSERRACLGAQARRTVIQHYTWSAISDGLDALYRALGTATCAAIPNP